MGPPIPAARHPHRSRRTATGPATGARRPLKLPIAGARIHCLRRFMRYWRDVPPAPSGWRCVQPHLRCSGLHYGGCASDRNCAIPCRPSARAVGQHLIAAGAGCGRINSRSNPPSLPLHLTGPDVTTGSERAIGINGARVVGVPINASPCHRLAEPGGHRRTQKETTSSPIECRRTQKEPLGYRRTHQSVGSDPCVRAVSGSDSQDDSQHLEHHRTTAHFCGSRRADSHLGWTPADVRGGGKRGLQNRLRSSVDARRSSPVTAGVR
jgi:hypothetical protein